jgi:subtilisin family serine protease
MNGARLRLRLAVALAAGLFAGGLLLASHPPRVAGLPAAASPTAEATVEARVHSQMQNTGKATYWVVLRERADLKPAQAMSDRARGHFVVDELRAVARRSQAGLQSLLRARGADFTSFWAANVLQVTSDAATLDAVARRPEVAAVVADRIYEIPEPLRGVQQSTVQGVEWNIANIRAPDVWSAFHDRGEGIVVGSIDTGVQFDHPALVNQYRGNVGSGLFNHNYNWFDPSHVCGNPSAVPCDNVNHGTHTMGTIVGDDGGANEIGVAPGARWITAKGCESSSCSAAALVAAGQWMLAPTDLTGQNARADLRPNIVSNSWGGNPGDTFYQQIVQAWVAAGIFPVFANGNNGPACGSVGSPGDYPESYGVGAYDSANLIASFSSRGASTFGVIKPNISAPGVNVNSSIPGGGYTALNGTSMATPHVAGTVALMWAAAPTLVDDVDTTRQILDQTAVDTADKSCRGSTSNNNVYGEGRLDAFAAVELSPRSSTGTLQGTVKDSVSGKPLAGMWVTVAGPSTRTTTTNAAGGYVLALPTGTYEVTVSGFGYTTLTVNDVLVTDGAVTTQDAELTPLPSYTLEGALSGTNGQPVVNATVTILGAPIAPTTSDALTGAYAFHSVPAGTYTVKAEAGHCNDPETQSVVLARDLTLNFTLPSHTDAFGYSCSILTPAWVEASVEASKLLLTGDDALTSASLPFPFPFYGVSYSTVYVTTDGYLSFVPTSVAYFSNTNLPWTYEPNAAVYVFWDDLYMDASSSAQTEVIDQEPNRGFLIEWRNVGVLGDLTQRIDAEAVLYENGEIVVQYRNTDPQSTRERGSSATLGLENAAGTAAFQYSYNEAVVFDGLAIRYAAPPFTGITGRVSDANDGMAVPGATVRVEETEDSAQTDANGYYQFSLPLDTYTLSASALNLNYGEGAASVVVLDTPDQAVTQDFALPTARASLTPATLTFSIGIGESASQTLTISDTGGLPLSWWQIEEDGGVAWLSEAPDSGLLDPSASQRVQVTANATGLASGTYTANLIVHSNSGRSPIVFVPVTLNVTPKPKGRGKGG